MVFFRDGSACGQGEPLQRLARDAQLLYANESEAVRDGLARLSDADQRGKTVALTTPG